MMTPTQLVSKFFNWGSNKSLQPNSETLDTDKALELLQIDKRTLGLAKLLKDKNRAVRWAEQLLGIVKTDIDEYLVWKRQPVKERLESMFDVPKSLVEFMSAVYTQYGIHKKEDHGAWKFVDSKEHLKIAVNSLTKLTPAFCDQLEPVKVVDEYAKVIVRVYFALFVQLHGVKQKTNAQPKK